MRQLRFMLYIVTSFAFVACSSNNSTQVVNPDIGGGKVLLYKANGSYLGSANVGDLPDSVLFADDRLLITANEGEPSDDYITDPKGSVSIIELNTDNAVQTVTTLDFTNVTVPSDVRIRPGSSAADDLEPEYIAVSPDGNKAWVSLQENNAIAIIDLVTKTVEGVKSLGAVNLSNQRIDIADDGQAHPVTAPANIFALHQPDTIVATTIGNQTYVISANEGDDRDYSGWQDAEKVNNLELSDSSSALSTALQAALLDTNMKKLRVFTDLGKDANGVYQSLYIAGTRSFSIWDANANLVFDSGSAFEDYLAQHHANVFNNTVGVTSDADEITDLQNDSIPYETINGTAYYWDSVDARSLKKGPEPEALTVAQIGSKTFVYVGLERQGGFFIYDITTPSAPTMVDYVSGIDYTQLPSQAGDIAPEGMNAFVQNGANYLAVANEFSSTVTLYQLANDGTASKLDTISLGTFGGGAAEIVSYDDQKLYVTNAETNTVDIIDVSTPTNLTKAGSIDFSAQAASLQSVAARNGVIAIAVK